SLALPIVQSYEADSNYSTWTMDESTRFVIPATDEYKGNERLKEVVELVSAEFFDKELPTNSEIEKVYAKESEITSNDIVVNLDEYSASSEGRNSDEANKIENR